MNRFLVLCGPGVATLQPKDLERAAASMRGQGQAAPCIGKDASLAWILADPSPEAAAGGSASVDGDPGPGPVRVWADARLTGAAALGRELGAAWPATHKDLLRLAYLQDGARYPSRVEGEFSVVIHDARSGRLHVARDRYGCRPVYLYRGEGLWAVSNSLLGFDALAARLKLRINEAQLIDALDGVLEAYDHECTGYLEVQRLPPGHWLEAEVCAGRSIRQRYHEHRARTPSPRSTGADLEQELRTLLQAAVAEVLTDDPAAGVMLSGGVDSASVAVTAGSLRSAIGAKVSTFSAIDSARADCLETHGIQALLAMPNFKAHTVDLADDRWLADWWQDFDRRESPFDGILSVVWHVCWLARQTGTRTLMTGLDADTLLSAHAGSLRALLGGYGRMLVAGRGYYGGWRGVMDEGRDCLRHALIGHRPLGALHRRWRRQAYVRGLEQRRQEAGIDREAAERCHYADRIETETSWAPISGCVAASDAVLRCLGHPYLAAGLERYHRVASAFGISPAHPFLYRPLAEFLAGVDYRFRVAGTLNKVLLRSAMAGDLPDAVRLQTERAHLGWPMTLRALRSRMDETQRRIVAAWDALGGRLLDEAARPDLAKLDEWALYRAFRPMLVHAWWQARSSSR
jgi:asparagine synthase (glutamine-hydrolysing)